MGGRVEVHKARGVRVVCSRGREVGLRSEVRDAEGALTVEGESGNACIVARQAHPAGTATPWRRSERLLSLWTAAFRVWLG